MVSEEDLQLLQRVKWLLGQYRDAKLHEQEQQHHQTSLELVSFPILKELPGEDTSSVSSSDKHGRSQRSFIVFAQNRFDGKIFFPSL